MSCVEASNPLGYTNALVQVESTMIFFLFFTFSAPPDFLFKSYFVYMGVWIVCSENWSYRWLLGTMWFLGTRSGSSERPTSALNLPAISLAIYYLCM